MQAVVGVIVWFGLVVGHIGLLSYSLNWWYGHALPHRLLSGMRLLHGALVLAGVGAFTWALALGFDWPGDLTSGAPLRVIAGVYALLCLAVGYGVVPAIAVYRRLHARPALVLDNHSSVLDVAAQVGYKPYGRAKYLWMARFPGNQVFQVEFSEKTFALPRLPAAWDGLTLLHLTDLHLRGIPDKVYYQRVLDACNDWRPDLVALTGDIVDSEHHHRWVVPLLGRLRWRLGAFAILGNHDYWQDIALIQRRLRRVGFTVLDNSWTQVELLGEPLVVVGHQGPWFAPEPNLTGCPEGPFRLCLSHTPDNMPWCRANHMDLVLAGHNHGGQIRFPLVGSCLVPSKFSRRYDCGTFYEPPTVLHVCRGLGGQHPLRYNCRPEVTKITLRCAAGREIAQGPIRPAAADARPD